MIRDIKNSQRSSDENSSDDDAFRLDAMDYANDIVKIVEPVGPVPMSGDDAFVLYANSGSSNIAVSTPVWFAEEQVYLSATSAWSRHVLPLRYDTVAEIGGDLRATCYEVEKNAGAENIRMLFEAMVVVPGSTDCRDYTIEWILVVTAAYGHRAHRDSAR